MDSDDPPPLGAAPCPCSCLCCGPSSVPSPAWRYSLKRKLDQLLTIAGEVPETEFARVEVENEAAALRETLASHQHSVQDLYTELEEERNASASTASEAMSMILRLQREKAEVMMEARQFRCFAEEKMAHDQHEIATLEDLLYLGPITEPQTPDSATGATPRLQALEADRESMKQALISMRTEKAQLVLLREIAQQLCKEAKPEPEPERRVAKKASLVGGFWSFAVFKWIVSILTWRRKAAQSKYTFGMTKNNAGLLLLVDKSPSTRHSRCLPGTRR